MATKLEHSEQIRNDQLNYGREILSLGKRTAKYCKSGSANYNKNKSEKTSASVNHKSEKTLSAKKRRLDGHEIDIKSAMVNKQDVEIILQNGTATGKIVKFDKYTIKLDTGTWIFKHAIVGIRSEWWKK